MFRSIVTRQWRGTAILFRVLFSLGLLCPQYSVAGVQPANSSTRQVQSKAWSLIRKAPYLIYNGKPGEMQVQWQLDSTATSLIAWGTDPTYSTGSAQTTEYGNDHQHKFTIQYLSNATKYYYRVIAGTDTLYGSFYTAPDSAATKLKFLAYGDTRSYPGDHNTIAGRIIDEFTTDSAYQSLIIVVGDLVSRGDEESYWTKQFFDPAYPNIITMLANLPYQSCMGNHEQSGVLFKKYFPYPFVAARYWSFDYGPAHFVVVDQYTRYSTGSAQLTWIENDLAASTKPWKFLYLHEPGWSAGGHSNSSMVQRYIQPLCEKYNVPIVFGGHNHYYARAEINGVQHITTGGGGAPLYSPIPTSPGIITTAQVHHYCKIEIDGAVLYFSAIDERGTEIDRFVMNKYGIKLLHASVSAPFVHMGRDSLLVLTELENPLEHSVNLQALIHSAENAFADSAQLFDDGAHGDGTAGDGVWGNFYGPVPIEADFTVDIAVTDLDSGMYFVSADMARFTSIGPLVLYDYTITSNDTIPNHGDRLKFKFMLKNSGTTATAKNITSRITPLDSCATLPIIAISKYGDIPPGETAMGSNKHYIKFSLNCPDSIYVPIEIQIYSNQVRIWSDTFAVFITKEPTGVGSRNEGPVDHFELSPNYPNPFNPRTVIRYQLPATTRVDLSIYNLRGQKVTTLVSEKQPAGRHKVQWDASGFASGVYFYKLKTAQGLAQARKMVYLR